MGDVEDSESLTPTFGRGRLEVAEITVGSELDTVVVDVVAMRPWALAPFDGSAAALPLTELAAVPAGVGVRAGELASRPSRLRVAG
jgi:hypothetical protein